MPIKDPPRRTGHHQHFGFQAQLIKNPAYYARALVQLCQDPPWEHTHLVILAWRTQDSINSMGPEKKDVGTTG